MRRIQPPTSPPELILPSEVLPSSTYISCSPLITARSGLNSIVVAHLQLGNGSNETTCWSLRVTVRRHRPSPPWSSFSTHRRRGYQKHRGESAQPSPLFPPGSFYRCIFVVFPPSCAMADGEVPFLKLAWGHHEVEEFHSEALSRLVRSQSRKARGFLAPLHFSPSTASDTPAICLVGARYR